MIFAITAAIAAGLSEPAITSLFAPSDYPDWAMKRGASAASIVEVGVDPQGKVIACRNVRNFGDDVLAKEFCRILKRKRLKPAPDRDGRVLHFYYETLIRMYLPDTRKGQDVMRIQESPDAELAVNQLPKGTSADVKISLVYDQSGKITDCEPLNGTDRTLAAIACSQRSLFEGAIRNDAAGHPVPYLTWKNVRFSVSPQK